MLQEVKPVDYYENTTRSIVTAGYNDISTDVDDRQKKMWAMIVRHNLTVRVEENFDFLENLADPTDKYYEIAQSRSKDINSETVNDLYEDIYVLEKRMLRIPIGFEIDGKFYPASGNHRSRVRKKHQENGNPSDGAVLIVGDELSTDEKVDFLHLFAVISNRHDDHQTARETEDDIVHQLRMHRQLFESKEPKKAKKFTEDSWCTWGKAWVCDHKEEYKRPRMAARLGIIVRKAFEIDRGQSLSMPDDAQCAVAWSEYWSTDTFESGAGKANNIVAKKVPAHAQNVKNILSARWENTPDNGLREQVWLVARAGETLEKKINKMSTVTTNRETFISNMKEWNAHPKREKANFPLVTKILFPEQIIGGGSMAVEWNHQSKNFDLLKIEPLADGRLVVTKSALE